MGSKKPDFKEYSKWLQEEQKIDSLVYFPNYYDTVTRKMKFDFEASPFWKDISSNLPNFNDEYLQNTGFPLFRVIEPPVILIKPYESFFQKTYRRNILDNKNWPNEPNGGWWLPDNWFTNVNDALRTLFEVKYMDGVSYLCEKLKQITDKHNLRFEKHLEARTEGYYAAHVYVQHQFEIPRQTWDTIFIQPKVEIQITTQLQEVIRKLLHTYYEDKRMAGKKSDDFQWDYKSDEFAVTYLGHILHYLEGTIVEIRDQQRKRGSN